MSGKYYLMLIKPSPHIHVFILLKWLLVWNPKQVSKKATGKKEDNSEIVNHVSIVNPKLMAIEDSQIFFLTQKGSKKERKNT